jgi:hypothetical protein
MLGDACRSKRVAGSQPTVLPTDETTRRTGPGPAGPGRVDQGERPGRTVRNPRHEGSLQALVLTRVGQCPRGRTPLLVRPLVCDSTDLAIALIAGIPRPRAITAPGSSSSSGSAPT